MDVLGQQLINGLVMGSLYALVALGYTMVYGIINLINFAHGEVLMVGAITSWSVMEFLAEYAPGVPLGLSFLISIVLACLVCALINVAIEKLAYRPLRHAPKLAPLITAIGVSILLQTLVMIIFKPTYKSYINPLPSEPLNVGPWVITPTQITILVVTALLLVGLNVLVNHTALGRAMRATSENQAMASLMGVKVDQVISWTFAIGAVLACVAGVLWAANFGTVHHAMGFMPGLKAFTAAVLGGIGNLPGAVLGGLCLGLIESIGSGYLGALSNGVLGSQYSDIFAFAVLIFMLTLRPAGLLGERVAERA
jgi:branched-chain amino acid transport system permease protein